MSETKPKIESESTDNPKGDIHRIRLGSSSFSIPTIAFGMMLVGILLPTTMFSLSLRNPSPTDLLIAICMALFSAVVFLWILDATSLLRFRAEWVSKSIYGAAVVSVLGTSVAVYKEAFSDRKYPYEGRWDIQITSNDQPQPIANNHLIMMYSTAAETYWGFSDYTPRNALFSVASWIKINEFDNKSGRITISYFSKNNQGVFQEEFIEAILTPKRNNKLFKASISKKLDEKDVTINISLARPKY